MRNIVGLFLLFLASPAAAAGACQEHQILGAWEGTGGGGFFEQFELSKRGTAHSFNSWLHDRPGLVDAAWQLRGCQLTIIPKDGGLPPFNYAISVAHGKLLLRQPGKGAPASYSRIKGEP